MTDQDRDILQLQRLVDADRPAASVPDLPRLLDAGHRRLRRRRISTGAAALAVAAAVAVPAYVVAGSGSGSGSDAAPDPAAAPAVPTSDGQCGVVLCSDPQARVRPERDQVVGAPWVVGELADGTEEVIYTVRADGTDLRTGEATEVEVLTVGFRRDGVLHPLVRTVQPGHDGRSPAGCDVRMWSNPGRVGESDGDRLLVVGYVDGTPDEITWTMPATGETGAVDGTDTHVLPGRTVFYSTLTLPEGDGRPGRPTFEKKGEDEYLVLPGGDSARPEVTFATSDGWSYNLEDCGSVG